MQLKHTAKHMPGECISKMARPSANIPGWEGKFGENKVTIAIQFPAKYIDHVKEVLASLQEEIIEDQKISFQDAIKLATLAFFPVPEREEETAKVVKAHLGNSILGFAGDMEVSREDVPLRPKYEPTKVEVTAGVEVAPSRQIKFSTSTIETPAKPEQKKTTTAPPSRVTETYFEDDNLNRLGFVTVNCDRTHIYLRVEEIGIQHPVVEHKWTRNEFGFAEQFYEDQAKALYAIYNVVLKKFPKDKLVNAIVEAFNDQFDESPRENEGE